MEDNSLTTRKPKGTHSTVSSSWRWFRRYTWLIRSCFPFQSIASLHWVCQGRPSAPAPGKKFFIYVFTEGPTHTAAAGYAKQPQMGKGPAHEDNCQTAGKAVARRSDDMPATQCSVPGTSHPSISQLCDKASRHCGTKPNNNRTNVTIPRYVETFVQQCRDRL